MYTLYLLVIYANKSLGFLWSFLKCNNTNVLLHKVNSFDLLVYVSKWRSIFTLVNIASVFRVPHLLETNTGNCLNFWILFFSNSWFFAFLYPFLTLFFSLTKLLIFRLKHSNFSLHFFNTSKRKSRNSWILFFSNLWFFAFFDLILSRKLPAKTAWFYPFLGFVIPIPCVF